MSILKSANFVNLVGNINTDKKNLNENIPDACLYVFYQQILTLLLLQLFLFLLQYLVKYNIISTTIDEQEKNRKNILAKNTIETQKEYRNHKSSFTDLTFYSMLGLYKSTRVCIKIYLYVCVFSCLCLCWYFLFFIMLLLLLVVAV